MKHYLCILLLHLLTSHFLLAQDNDLSHFQENFYNPKTAQSVQKEFNNLLALAVEALDNDSIQQALSFYSQQSLLLLNNNNWKELSEVLVKVASIWNSQYEFEKAAEVLGDLNSMAQAFNDSLVLSSISREFALGYIQISSYQKALKNAKDALNWVRGTSFYAEIIENYLCIANIFNAEAQLDSAKVYLDSAKIYSKKLNPDEYRLPTQIHFAEIEYLALNKKTLNEKLIDTLDILIHNNSPRIRRQKSILKAKIHYQLGNYLQAQENLNPIIDKLYGNHSEHLIALKIYLKSEIQLLGNNELYKYWNNIDVIIQKVNNRIYSDYQQRLNNRFNTIINQEHIKFQNSKLKNIDLSNKLFFGISLFIAFCISIGIYIISKQIKTQKVKHQTQILQLQQHVQQLELDNYNKQLDPHEIKNMISAIAPELLKNAPQAYRKMIKLFNITRASLNNEINEDLDTQIKQFEDLLVLYQNLWATPITYEIEQNINSKFSLPRLLLKNLVEEILKNSIKKFNIAGHIKLKIFENKSFCYITLSIHFEDTNLQNNILDNLAPNTSQALNTYQKLFNILNNKNVHKASINFNNKDYAFNVKIPLYYTYSI